MSGEKRSGEYMTRQRRRIHEVLLQSGEVHLSAAELYCRLVQKGEKIGKATVYRTLNKLVQEGLVTKYIAEKGMSACFAYRVQPECAKHTHLKCVVCGELFHLDCDKMQKLLRHINEAHRFRIDPSKTVFYGLCDSCTRKDRVK